MRIFAIADLKSEWYPRNAFLLFKRYSSFEFVDQPQEADVIWIFSYYLSIEILWSPSLLRRVFRAQKHRVRRSLRDKLIIATFHHLYEPKEHLYLPKVEQIDKISDVVCFPSRISIAQSQRYFQSPIILLPYWIDTSIFRPLPPGDRKRIRRCLGLPDNRCIIGSFQRDTEIDLVTPKLEKGPDVLCDVLELLDPDHYFVLLAGPRRGYVESRLETCGMAFKSLGKIPYERMYELYNCLDYYLVTSRCEGGPQAVLEAMATKTPIYSTPVGISCLLSKDVVLSGVDEFVCALKKPYPDVIETHYEVAQQYECGRVVRIYEETLALMYGLYRQGKATLRRHILAQTGAG